MCIFLSGVLIPKKHISAYSFLIVCIFWLCDDNPFFINIVITDTHGHTHVYLSVYVYVYISSVQFSCSVMSDSLQPHESQHARPPCTSPSPGVHSDSRPSSPWCHPAISSSVVPFSSCPQSLPASQSFPMSQLFAWSGQSTGVSALASFPPKNTQGWSPSEWTGWISLQSKGLSGVSPTPQFRSLNSSALSLLYGRHHQIQSWYKPRQLRKVKEGSPGGSWPFSDRRQGRLWM